MTNDDAVQALKASLATDSDTPNTGRSDRATYLREERSALLTYAIKPVFVVAHAGDWAQRHCGLSAEPYHMVAVAYCSDGVGRCLLHNPKTGMFSLAYGHLDDPEGLDLVGYSSIDALAQWLG